MSEMKVSKDSIRITCDCGKYVHVISQDDDGELKLESFLKAQRRTAPDDAPPAPPAPAPKKKTGFDPFNLEGGE